MRKSIALLAAGFAFTGNAFALNVTVNAGDGVCPANANLLTYDEAAADTQAVCAKLGSWYIARLAGGGSMDGPGYNCKLRRQDTRKLGNSLCKQQYSTEVTPGRTVVTGDMTNSQPWPPVDIYRPSGDQGANHQDLATFAWLNFIALSAPSGMRGNSQGSFADSGTRPGSTLVWETFQHRSELLPYNGAQFAGAPKPVAPQPWGAEPEYRMYAGGKPYPVPYSNFNNLDEGTQIAENLIFFPRVPGKPNPAEDWQILFEAKVNQSEFQYVYENYNDALATLSTAAVNGQSVPAHLTQPITLPEGTMEVKAAWRPLDSIPSDQRYRYHVKDVIYYTGDDTKPRANIGKYALIGLHIIHKTPNYPTFVYSTFQHVDNLVNQITGNGSGLYYVPVYDEIDYSISSTTTTAYGTYINPDIRLPNGTSFDPGNPQAAPNGRIVDLPKTSSSIPGAQKIQLGNGKYVIAVPVTAARTTNEAVARVNAQVLAAMRTLPGFGKNFVWRYYTLKGVQGMPTSDDTRADYYLANDVIESSQPGLQLFRGGTPTVHPILENTRNTANVMDPKQDNHFFSVGGCMGCHGVGQTQNGFDFSFLYFGTQGVGFSPDTLGLKSDEEMRATGAKYRR